MKKTKPVKVIIDRKKWSRGTSSNALLVDRDTVKGCGGNNPPKVGRMCCLGFACLSMGFQKQQIRGLAFPYETGKHIEGLTEWDSVNGFEYNSKFSRDAARINDNTGITDKQRETQLKTLAQKNGFIFQFIN